MATIILGAQWGQYRFRVNSVVVPITNASFSSCQATKV